jgi:hypothetical protein
MQNIKIIPPSAVVKNNKRYTSIHPYDYGATRKKFRPIIRRYTNSATDSVVKGKKNKRTVRQCNNSRCQNPTIASNYSLPYRAF